jgi:hypothetical protein
LKQNFVSLGSKKRHDFPCFALKQNCKIMKRKRTENKRNETKKFKQNKKELKNCLTKKNSEAKTSGK